MTKLSVSALFVCLTTSLSSLGLVVTACSSDAAVDAPADASTALSDADTRADATNEAAVDAARGVDAAEADAEEPSDPFVSPYADCIATKNAETCNACCRDKEPAPAAAYDQAACECAPCSAACSATLCAKPASVANSFCLACLDTTCAADIANNCVACGPYLTCRKQSECDIK